MLCSKCNQAADALTDGGLCEDCHIEAEDRRSAIIELAQQQHGREGSVEINYDAQISEGNDNGCYVHAWVWVDFAGTPFDKHKESEGNEKDTAP